MGSRRPKQYLHLGRAPILVATLKALLRARGIAGIVVAVPEAHVAGTRRLLARLRLPRILEVVAGGADRQGAVWGGAPRARARPGPGVGCRTGRPPPLSRPRGGG